MRDKGFAGERLQLSYAQLSKPRTNKPSAFILGLEWLADVFVSR